MIGRVTSLLRYPVKAMAPEELAEAELSRHGILGDRRWALVRAGSRAGGRWLTLRERPDLSCYAPRITDADRPDEAPVQVECPDGTVLEASDPRLAARIGDGCRARRRQQGTHDALPFSLVTTATVAAVGRGSDTTPDARRFRPNLVIEPARDEAFTEANWVGRYLAVGDAVMHVVRLDQRCVVVNVDPRSGAVHPAVLRLIARQCAGLLGVYASIATPGTVRVGQPVRLLP